MEMKQVKGIHEAVAQKACQILLEQGKAADADYSAKQLADDLGCNVKYLSMVFRKALKTTYPQYVNKIRIEKAMRLLKTEKEMTMEEIGKMCGFKTRVSFYANFHKSIGITPKEFQNGSVLKTNTKKKNKTNVLCGNITLSTLESNFPKDTSWTKRNNEWQGYSASLKTIYIISDGHRAGTKEVYPVAVISSAGAEHIEIENKR